MAGLGIGIAWFGYSVFYYGFTQVNGGNWGFLDLIIPSRWPGAADIARDDGSHATNTTPAKNAAGSRQPQVTPGNGVQSTSQQVSGVSGLAKKLGIPGPVQQGIR
jgi:hypothetical protein